MLRELLRLVETASPFDSQALHAEAMVLSLIHISEPTRPY